MKDHESLICLGQRGLKQGSLIASEDCGDLQLERDLFFSGKVPSSVSSKEGVVPSQKTMKVVSTQSSSCHFRQGLLWSASWKLALLLELPSISHLLRNECQINEGIVSIKHDILSNLQRTNAPTRSRRLEWEPLLIGQTAMHADHEYFSFVVSYHDCQGDN